MKKLVFLALSMIAVATTSCKKDSKKETEKTPTTETKGLYSVTPETVAIKWTAYKTTAKKGVGGKFTEVAITKSTPSSEVANTFDDLEFKIPVNSLFTDNESRDHKIKTNFFGTMTDTNFITGVFKKSTEGNYKVALKMNGITHDLPLSHSIDGQKITFKGVLDVKNWKAQTALAALNRVCYDLHKGADGISKTWEDVAIEAVAYLKAQ